MNPLVQRTAILPHVIAVSLACLALLPAAQAVVPPPDGGYPNFTTAEGDHALQALTTGLGNTAVGTFSLFGVSTGSFNTAVGAGALDLNTADSNTALGAAALLFNTTGTENTANGTAALEFNHTASNNTANGAFALGFNVDSFNNTAVGAEALFHNDSDGMGFANNNTAVGVATLSNNVDGSQNTAVGAGAGANVIGGVNNTYVGDFVGSLAADESSTIRIGDRSNGDGSLACFIGGIFGNFQPVGGTVVQVTLDTLDDHLGWDFGPNQGGTAPVQHGTSLRRSAPQPHQRPQLQHQAMLNGKVEKLEATVGLQQTQIEILTTQLREQADTFTAQLREQATQIQKVSARLEASKPALQVVKNP